MLAVAPSLLSAAFVAMIARFIGARSWLHLQDFEVDAAFDLGLLGNRRLKKLMLYVEGRILKSFDRVSTISPQMLRRLENKGLDPKKLREVRNWTDTKANGPYQGATAFRRNLDFGVHHFVGLYSGTMSNKQGLDLLVDTAKILERSHPSIQFVLCGEGPYKTELMRLASSLTNIHFLHLQPVERLGELLSTADFHLIPQKAAMADLVLPSKLGGILASGRPVIVMASKGTALANEVEDVGLIVSPGDTLSLVAAICALDDDRSLGPKLGDRARSRALERWDRSAIVKNWIREILTLVCPPHESDDMGSPMMTFAEYPDTDR